MTSKQLSPSAQLLRHSKLFSLPPVLNRPPIRGSGAQAVFESDTATIHRPTHAAITTTNSARFRGEWGLKRNLPLRSTTRSSTPVVRVRHVDNIDHITDFESAADHVLTLRKYQEMNVPIHRHEKRQQGKDFKDWEAVKSSNIDETAKGVFDAFEPPLQPVTKALQGDTFDNEPQKTQRKPSRWKWNGPWLPGMDHIQFERYIEKQIKSQRSEFRDYLWDIIIDKKWTALKGRESQDVGFDNEVGRPTLSEEEFQAEVVRMRANGEELWKIVWKFLDLPGPAPGSGVDHSQGPPATHPSAGLSYLRTGPQISNHPILGPVRDGLPIPSRALQDPRDYRGGLQDGGPLIGIGGIVAEASRNDFQSFGQKPPVGGEKYYFHPKQATVDSTGRILLNVKKASPDAEAIWENKVGDREEDDKKQEDQINFFQSTKMGGFDKLLAKSVVRN